jgi:UDP-2,3-diacylglucosamine hydrolase
METIGLVAGNGFFPREFIANVRTAGHQVAVAAHYEETDPAVLESATFVEWIHVGQIARTIRFFKKNNVKTVAFLGGIKRQRLFRKVRLDWLAMKILARAIGMQDDAVLRAVAQEYESRGITVISPIEFLGKSCAQSGCLTQRGLSSAERKAAQLGWEAAETLGRLDTGQTAVVNRGIVVALEAIEGTDATITRAGVLSGPGCVVVKLPKPIQDRRLDLPAIGPDTIEKMQSSRATALVLQHHGALLLNPAEIIRLADKADIAIEVVEDLSMLRSSS